MMMNRGFMLAAGLGIATGSIWGGLSGCRAAQLAPSTVNNLDDVLARARAAVDADWSGRGWVARGRTEYLGVAGEYSVIFEGSGAFATQTTGPLGQEGGFNGTVAWERDFAGSFRELESGDRMSALIGTWLVTGEWFDRAGEIDLRLEEADDDGVRLSFAIGEWAERGTIELDEESFLPVRGSWTEGSSTVVVELRDWTDFGGLTMPASMHQTADDIEINSWIEHVEEAPVFVRSPYEPVRGQIARFDAAAPAALEVERAPSGHMFVRGLIDGKDSGWLIFDTGAGANIINNRVAEDLGLTGIGEVVASGVGGKVKTAFYRPQSMTVGPATLEEPVMVGLDLTFLEGAFGRKIAGIVGYNMLSEVVAEVDMEEGTVSLYDPAAYERQDATWGHLALIGRHPCVEAEFEGHKALFRIDTGAGSETVIFHGGAVEYFDLLEGRETRPSALGGVGGFIQAARGELKDFTIAGHRLDNVPATFAKPGQGAMNDPWLGGTVGGGVLKPYVMVLDYPRGRIGFVER